jgi:hypothetical protein
MSILKTLKTDASETVVLMLVPDAFLPHISEFMDDLKTKWFAGEPPFKEAMEDVITLTTATVQGAPELPHGSDIVSLIRRAASVGVRMTDSQQRRMVELFGDARCSAMFGPNWGEGAFKLAKVADRETLTRHDGKWVTVPNQHFRQDVLDAIIAFQPPAPPIGDPMVIPFGPDTSNDHLLHPATPPQQAVPQDVNYYQPQQFVPPQYAVSAPQVQQAYQQTPPPQGYAGYQAVPQSYGLNPAQYQAKLDELIKLSYTGRDLSNPQIGLIDKTIKMGAYRIFPGRKDGPMQEFLRLCGKTKRKEDKSGYEPNPAFDQGFFSYVNQFCGNQN